MVYEGRIDSMPKRNSANRWAGLRSVRHACHRRIGATVFDLVQQYLGSRATDDISDHINWRKSAKSSVVVQRHDLVRLQTFGLGQSALSHSRDHSRSLVFRCEYGHAADTADCSGNQDRLPRLDSAGNRDQLVSSDRDERQRTRLNQVKATRDLCQKVCLDNTKLGVGMERPRENPVADGELLNFWSELENRPGDIPTDDPRKLDW